MGDASSNASNEGQSEVVAAGVSTIMEAPGKAAVAAAKVQQNAAKANGVPFGDEAVDMADALRTRQVGLV